MCAFVSTGISRVAEAALVKPTLQGVLVSWYGLAAVGLSAATLFSMGYTDSFFLETIGAKRSEPRTSMHRQHRPSIPLFLKVLCRCLLVPAFAEEAFWRCFLHPHPTSIATGGEMALSTFPWATILQIVIINTAFTLYHPIIGKIVWEYLPLKIGAPSLRRPGVLRVFSDPAFLILTFILGFVCSGAFLMSGGALYAPVVIHGVAVAVWLELLGGARALRIHNV